MKNTSGGGSVGGPLVVIAIIFGLLGISLLIIALIALKKRAFSWGVAHFIVAILCFSLGGLLVMISLATLGYRTLTREEVAARMKIDPQGSKRFRVIFSFPSGGGAVFNLAGDELYVDAHILKWKAALNLLGWHTTYELDRVAGRYFTLEDEQKNPRTVFPLAQDKPLNMFHLRRKFPWLRPLVDAEYGSATFIPANKPGNFELRVSTTGLLIRKAE
jgi:hypothetical protein